MTPREFETNIAGSVDEFTYAKNHHWLRLKSDGVETTMIEKGLIRYSCTQCQYTFWAESDLADHCSASGCMGKLERQWMRPQVSLVPEKESDFAFQDPDAEQEADTEE